MSRLIKLLNFEKRWALLKFSILLSIAILLPPAAFAQTKPPVLTPPLCPKGSSAIEVLSSYYTCVLNTAVKNFKYVECPTPDSHDQLPCIASAKKNKSGEVHQATTGIALSDVVSPLGCAPDNVLFQPQPKIYSCMPLAATSYVGLSACVPYADVTPCVGTASSKTYKKVTADDTENLMKKIEALNAQITEREDDGIIFIGVDRQEKSVSAYIQKNFKDRSEAKKSSADERLGLAAFTVPSHDFSRTFTSDQKFIPVVLKAHSRMMGLTQFLYLRNRYLPERFGKVADKNNNLEKQKQIFQDELITRLKLSVLINDDPNRGYVQSNSESLGCTSYEQRPLIIVNRTVLDARDGEVAQTQKSNDQNLQSRAAFISGWYQIMGTAPYVAPVQSTQNELDDPLKTFIRENLITCKKIDLFKGLPDLKNLAPNFLKEFEAAVVHATTKDFHLFHWAEHARIYGTQTKLNDINFDNRAPEVEWYLSYHWKKFFFEPSGSDAAGNGLYFSPNPAVTAHLGDTVIDMLIPKGTRYVSFIYNNRTKLSAAAINEMTKLGCALTNVDADRLFQSYTPGCLNVGRALARTLKLSMTLYDYTYGVADKACEGGSIPGWAFVVYDSKLLHAKNVSLFNRYKDLEADTLTPEQKMIANYLSRNGYRQSSVKNLNVPNPDFSTWVNSEILGCGMPEGWSKTWN